MKPFKQVVAILKAGGSFRLGSFWCPLYDAAGKDAGNVTISQLDKLLDNYHQSPAIPGKVRQTKPGSYNYVWHEGRTLDDVRADMEAGREYRESPEVQAADLHRVMSQ